MGAVTHTSTFSKKAGQEKNARLLLLGASLFFANKGEKKESPIGSIGTYWGTPFYRV
jgi:hypothetical protein